MPNSFRWAGVMAIVVVLSVAWVVHRTVDRARDSSKSVAQTQHVLTAIEAILARLADVESVVSRYVPSADARQLEPLDQAEREIEADISRLAALTSDNPTQQARVPQLRQAMTRALSTLRAMAEAKRAAAATSPVDADAGRADLDAVRLTLQAMRTEENRLLAERVLADMGSVDRLQSISIALAMAASGLLGLLLWLFSRNTRRAEEGADTLRRAKAGLEAEVGARDADLRNSNARLRSIIDSAVDGIIVIDARGRIEAFNRGAERLFGYPEAEVTGRNVSMLMPSPYHEEHDAYLARYLETGTAKIMGIGREVTGRRRDGTSFPLHLSVGEMLVDGERKFTGILHDLSMRVRIEAQLREQTSLARLGEMAAVIAHEVKNPLAGVRGAIQVIGTRLPKDSKDAPMITEIVSRIDALDELMKDLLLFARPPQPKLVRVDLAMLVAATVDLLRGDPNLKNVRVTVEGTPGRVMADAQLLKIVFVNLLVNAAHAMQGHGSIRVALTSIADTCQIAFTDEGPGIPADVLEKIFVPFFTTKTRGSGLGLPTAKRLVEAHRGSITIACPPDGGTVVTIQLPAEREATAV